MKLGELAARLGCELRGDANIEVHRVAPIETAGAGDLTFVGNARYARYLDGTPAAAVIVTPEVAELPVATLRVKDPHLAFAKAIEIFHVPVARPVGVHPTATIAPTAIIGPDASIGAYVVIGDAVRIGAQATLAPHVVIYPQVVIGDRFTAHAHVTVRERTQIGHDVILHAGAVIGSDGFGYVLDADGSIRKIVQAGIVVLEDRVEIGANATIDRAAVGATVVRRSAKIDNLVMIAHGCEIGEGSMLAAQVGLAGSTHVGRFVRMGGQAGAAGHLSIGDGAQVGAQCGVTNAVPPHTTVNGTPALDIGLYRRVAAAWKHLPALVRRVRRLEKLLGAKAESDEPP
jgi:UDP-3-O-[3-hydroxymyristoyl] glucosamine N-acyltransferase